MKRWLMILAGLLAPALGAGPALAEPLKVVASMSVLGDMVARIGGADVQVITLVGPNADAHGFEPTPANAKAIKDGRLVVMNGLGLEHWLNKLIASSGYKGPVVVATKGVTPLKSGEPGTGGLDPHAWQNVANARIYVTNIAQALAQADPAHAPSYRANAEAYGAELAQLDAEVKAAFATIPKAQRKIVTSHDAFGYFGAAYGLTLLAPEGVSTESEPSAKAVARLITQIKRDHVKAIFVENISDPRLIEQIARESGTVVGGQLFSDALSAKDGPAASYIAMIRHNTTAISRALAAGS